MPYTMHTSFVVHVCDQIGDDGHDIEAVIGFSVHPARAATLEEPAEDASVSIHNIYVDGSYAPGWLFEMAEKDDGLTAELLDHAVDTDEYDRDQAYDARREDRLA